MVLVFASHQLMPGIFYSSPHSSLELQSTITLTDKLTSNPSTYLISTTAYSIEHAMIVILFNSLLLHL